MWMRWNMRRLRLSSLAIGTGLTLAWAASASALAIDPANSALEEAIGCADAFCFPTLFELTDPTPVSGSLSLVDDVLSFSIQLASAELMATNGSDGGVGSIVFSEVTYSGSVTVTPGAGQALAIDLGQLVSVFGSVTPIGAGSPATFQATQVLLTGGCSGSAETALICGLIFEPDVDFNADVNGNTRSFQHVVDVAAAVPEPGTAMLLGLGLAGLASAGRARVHGGGMTTKLILVPGRTQSRRGEEHDAGRRLPIRSRRSSGVLR